MLDEKVTLVKFMIAKLAQKVPTGYSKSTDKIAEHIKAQDNGEVNQFFSDENPDLEKRRYLDPAKITTKLKAEEEDGEGADEEKKANEKSDASEETKSGSATAASSSKEETKDDSNSKDEGGASISGPLAPLSAGEEQERKEIQAVEKTVQIRLCNYSMLVRA